LALNSGLWFLLFLLIVFLLRHVDHGGKHLTSSSYCPIKGVHLSPLTYEVANFFIENTFDASLGLLSLLHAQDNFSRQLR
jgi:hypothetical protein